MYTRAVVHLFAHRVLCPRRLIIKLCSIWVITSTLASCAATEETTSTEVLFKPKAHTPIPCVDAARYLGAAYQLRRANEQLRGGAEGLFISINNAMFKTTLATIIAASEHLQANLELQGGRYKQDCLQDSPGGVTPPEPPKRSEPTLYFTTRQDARVVCKDVTALAEGAADFSFAAEILCAATPGVCHQTGEACQAHQELCDKMKASAVDVVDVLTYRGECRPGERIDGEPPSAQSEGEALPCPVVELYGEAAGHARSSAVALRQGVHVLLNERGGEGDGEAEVKMVLSALEQLALGFAQRQVRYEPMCTPMSASSTSSPTSLDLRPQLSPPRLTHALEAAHSCEAIRALFDARDRFASATDAACQSVQVVCDVGAESCDEHEGLCEAMRDNLLVKLTDYTRLRAQCRPASKPAVDP